MNKINKNSIMCSITYHENILDKAQEIKKISTDVNFDTNNSVEKAFDKIKEEFLELEEEVRKYLKSKDKKDFENIQKELGDLLFATGGLANRLGIRCHDALKMTNDKFVHRFCYVEKKLKENNQDFASGNMEEMCNWWREAKKFE